jgi:hypothetical protein
MSSWWFPNLKTNKKLVLDYHLMKTYGCYNYPKMVVCYMGANVQKWTSFHGVVIKKTLEGFV